MMFPKTYALALAVFALLVFAVPSSFAGNDRILHTFAGASAYPSSGLITDGAGNYYGVTQGSVYELSLAAGVWSYKTIQLLPGGLGDFAGGNLLRDAAGNLYGSAYQGGASGCGYIFELSPASAGAWTFLVLYNLTCTDGAGAGRTMAMDAEGNIYGGAENGGANDEGVAYELSPIAGGGWTYTVLHTFSTPEGNGPQTGVVLDASGNLYGGNETGIFKLTPNGDGTWIESTAYSFTTEDGSNPFGDPIFDSAGNLYGTNQAGGEFEGGTAFKLTPSGSGFTSTILHAFNPKSAGGSSPIGGLILDSAGNIYGTAGTTSGASGDGVVFKLGLVSGTWTEQVLHTFLGTASKDGADPTTSLLLDSSGVLLGTTAAGGSAKCSSTGCGVVFEVAR
jgi:uncharacterized repeat protein (TIGR03803 family)